MCSGLETLSSQRRARKIGVLQTNTEAVRCCRIAHTRYVESSICHWLIFFVRNLTDGRGALYSSRL